MLQVRTCGLGESVRDMNKQIEIEKALKRGNNLDRTRRRRNKIINKFLRENEEKENFIYWITFTLNNEYVNDKKIRQKLTDYLRHKKINYALFYDRGTEHERPHYHGFITSKKEIIYTKLNKFGHVYGEEIIKIDTFRCKTAEFYVSFKNIKNRIHKMLITRNLL